jgi:hypothetical protein
MGNSTGSLTITGFGADKNHDTNTTSGTTLSISGYQSDKDWDNSSRSGVTVSVTGYSSDKNYVTTKSSSGTISKKEYGAKEKEAKQRKLMIRIGIALAMTSFALRHQRSKQHLATWLRKRGMMFH